MHGEFFMSILLYPLLNEFWWNNFYSATHYALVSNYSTPKALIWTIFSKYTMGNLNSKIQWIKSFSDNILWILHQVKCVIHSYNILKIICSKRKRIKNLLTIFLHSKHYSAYSIKIG